MCGIASIFNYRGGAPVELEELVRIRDGMDCRGPDGHGEWVSDDRRVALAHRRLAIIDLSDLAAQPMSTPDGALVITFNGEIYNFRALRDRLERRGHSFTTQSDTEVLLHLYMEHGADMVHELRGMFAFALFDARRGGVLLARDHFGIKPLYYADDGATVRAASEVRALLRGSGVDRSAEPAAHAGFFLWGHVPEPYTMYRGIRALPAGSTMWIDAAGASAPVKYADVTALLRNAEERAPRLHPGELEQRLGDALRDTVRHHLVADVPVGVFLSAGIDSSTLTALASENGGTLKTVTLGFTEFRGTAFDETPLAEEVARSCGADHQTVWIGSTDFKEQSNRLLERMDQPSVDGVNSYFVARAAAKTGLKVALSGLGGDELFGGYPSFRDVPRLVRALGGVPGTETVGRGLRFIAAPIVGQLTSPKYASVLEYGGTWGGAYLLRRGMYMPWELPDVMDADLAREGWRELQQFARLDAIVDGIEAPRLKVSALEASWYMRNQLLRDTDWASMSHSLEVRVPLVDWTFWRAVAPLIAACPGSLPKRAIAETPRRPLPAAVLSRPKTGFEIPTREWLVGEHGAKYAGRGLRGWARFVYDRFAQR